MLLPWTATLTAASGDWRRTADRAAVGDAEVAVVERADDLPVLHRTDRVALVGADAEKPLYCTGGRLGHHDLASVNTLPPPTGTSD